MRAGAPERPLRLDSLTGLRFFAAFLVLQHHFTNLGLIPGLDSWTGFGTTGVSFFFVLSGFVLTWSRAAGDTARRFYWRRFARIWPLHVTTTLLALPVFYSGRHLPFDWTAILLSILLLHAWVPAVTVYFAGNPASWSLSCEAFFYALHPLAARHSARARATVLALAGLLLLLAAVAIAMFGDRLPIRDELGWLLYIFPGFRLYEFLLGVALATLLRRGIRLRVRLWPAVAGLFAWFALYYDVGPFLPSHVHDLLVALSYAVVPLSYALIIAAAAQRDLGGRRTWIRSRPLVALGEWSYALYLIHATIIYSLLAVVGVQPRSFLNILWLVVVSAVCILAAAFLHHAIERPVERDLRRLISLPPSQPDEPHPAAHAGGAGDAGIRRQQGRLQTLGQRDVGGVVRGQVGTELPHTTQQRLQRMPDDRQPLQAGERFVSVVDVDLVPDDPVAKGGRHLEDDQLGSA